VPINWQITRHTIPRPRSNETASPDRPHPAQGGGQTPLTLNHWEGLVRFLDDGRIEIDSNTVERAMRAIALTRKNALFAGSEEGAENWAMPASLIATCKLHGVTPQACFTDVLTRLLNNWPNRRLAELLPWAWAAAQSG
jgi:transposase